MAESVYNNRIIIIIVIIVVLIAGVAVSPSESMKLCVWITDSTRIDKHVVNIIDSNSFSFGCSLLPHFGFTTTSSHRTASQALPTTSAAAIGNVRKMCLGPQSESVSLHDSRWWETFT